jgi:hypothetical protein
MSITVADLKEKLQGVIDELDECYEDDDKIRMVSNTYFLGNANMFLGIAGYNGGYINLSNIETEEDDEEDSDD